MELIDNGRSDTEPKPGKARRYVRYILDPFQIFCIEKRSDCMKEHPDLKSSEITSILATKWRSMNDVEKQPYLLYAMNLQNNKCNVERKKKKSSHKDPPTSEPKTSSTPEISEPDVGIGQTLNMKTAEPPKIYIVSRTGVGHELSDMSYNLLKIQEKVYNEDDEEPVVN